MINLILNIQPNNDPAIKTLKKQLEKKIAILDKYLGHFSHPMTLSAKIEKIKFPQYRASLTLTLKDYTIRADDSAIQANIALEQAFNILKESLLQYLDKNKHSHQGN